MRRAIRVMIDDNGNYSYDIRNEGKSIHIPRDSMNEIAHRISGYIREAGFRVYPVVVEESGMALFIYPNSADPAINAAYEDFMEGEERRKSRAGLFNKINRLEDM